MGNCIKEKKVEREPSQRSQKSNRSNHSNKSREDSLQNDRDNSTKQGSGIRKTKLAEQRQILPVKLFCPLGNEILRVCTNPQCQRVLICGVATCYPCHRFAHADCKVIPIEEITYALKVQAQKAKDFATRVDKVTDEFLIFARRWRRSITDNIFFGDLIFKYRTVADQLFRRKKVDFEITGLQVAELMSKLQECKLKPLVGVDDLFNDLKFKMKEKMDQIFVLKQNFLQSFMTLNHKDQLKLFFNSIKSSVISKGETLDKEQALFLWQSLNQPSRVKLLYRGSENNFNVVPFHEKCDQIPDTLVLVRTEFGKKIGGFTRYPWNIKGGWVQNERREAFLLSLDERQKMIPNNQQYLINNENGKGPVFGGGDLVIADECNKNSGSYSNFPSSYNRQGPSRYVAGQSTYRMFSGATKGSSFRVDEYQVFQVIYE